MRNKIGLITGLISIGLITFLLTSHISAPRTGYVLIEELFSKFEMKKEMERKFNYTKNQRQKILDSLAIQLRIFANKLDAEEIKAKKEIEAYNYMREEYYQKQHSFEEDNKQLSSQYDREILSQLNQYVKDFGKKNNYQYIFGNDANGSLMYALDENNLTPEVINYINKRYSGKE